MHSGIPSRSPFVLREISGSEFFGFAQRIFTRDMRLLKKGEGFTCLLLDPQARLIEFFWLFQKSAELFYVIHPSSSPSWKENIELYHFSEKFEIGPGKSLQFDWEKPSQSPTALIKILDAQSWLVSWSEGQLFFSLGDFSNHGLPQWQKHRWENQILIPSEDSSKSRLIFDWGLENLCDPNKGCYVGQEIVERVKSRGGASSIEVLKCLWQTEPKPNEPISHQEKSFGTLSSSRVQLSADTFGSFVFAKKGLRVGDFIIGETSKAIGQIVDSPKTKFVT